LRKRIDLLLVLLALCYFGLQVLTQFLRWDIGIGLQVGDVVTLAAPLVVPLVAWLIWRLLRQAIAPGSGSGRFAPLMLLMGSLLYAEGIGMNITANAIARFLDQHASGATAFTLTYLLDEHVGHLLWHAGVLLLTLALASASWTVSLPAVGTSYIAAGSGMLYGFTWFTDGVEGQTVPLMFLAAIALALLCVRAARSRGPLTRNPAMLAIGVAAATAIALFSGWWIWQGGFPQFSELGWI
jgi:hypothetical protein